MSILIRKHRSTLDESMATVQEINDRSQLLDAIRTDMAQFFRGPISDDQISVTPYMHDSRVEWNTHIICISGMGVWGMSNGPIPAAVKE